MLYRLVPSLRDVEFSGTLGPRVHPLQPLIRAAKNSWDAFSEQAQAALCDVLPVYSTEILRPDAQILTPLSGPKFWLKRLTPRPINPVPRCVSTIHAQHGEKLWAGGSWKSNYSSRRFIKPPVEPQ